MRFTKMQGIGNDYVYVDCFKEQVENPEALAIKVSDRHFGIGSDGLILILPSEVADCRMDMYNLDGSRGAMCGNGIRCVGKYVYDHGIARKEEISVETLSGIKHLKIREENGKAAAITVDMGVPEITSQVPEALQVGEETYQFTGVSMGNPHAVIFMEEIDQLDLEHMGPGFEFHSRFPDRTNTEFIKVLSPEHIKMRVWERGSGETMACGTGACASVVASVLNGHTGRQVRVTLKGGDLEIFWDEESGHVFMTGPAVEVFCGEV